MPESLACPKSLFELQEALLPHFPLNVRKDVKTSVRLLARALGYADLQSCPLEVCLRPLPELYRLVEAVIITTDANIKERLRAEGKDADKEGPNTSIKIRNTKNNLSRLFRVAEAQGLCSLVTIVPEHRFSYSKTYIRRLPQGRYWNDGLSLIRRNWPSELEAAFAAFTKWATDPLVENRDARFQKRLRTIENYEKVFEAYFGYLHHMQNIQTVTFEHLYDLELIKHYIIWHVNEKHKRPTRAAHLFLKCLLTLTRQYHPNGTLREQIKSFQKNIPKPAPFYDKNEAWVSRRELRQVSMALWPPKPPKALKGNGRRWAARAGLSLIFQLWRYIPYRSRNIREMKLGENLKQIEKQWWIVFEGEEMKMSIRNGQLNEFKLPFPPALVVLLNDYLTIWRPILAEIHQRSEVFLTAYGLPYARATFIQATKRQVYTFTGKPHFHPHIVRTIWATEWIRAGRDMVHTAIMLNDTLATVINNYAHLRQENVIEEAYRWTDEQDAAAMSSKLAVTAR
jgi:hypothetical protein